MKFVEHPVWVDSDVRMLVEGGGLAAQVRIAESDEAIQDSARSFESIGIDDALGKLKLPSVEFIKMGVEVAEMTRFAWRETQHRDIAYPPLPSACIAS